MLVLKKDHCYAYLDGTEIKINLPLSYNMETNDSTTLEITLALSREKENLYAVVS